MPALPLLRCLGQFQLELHEQPTPLPTRKTAALLAYLVLHPKPHLREQLATLFWGDSGDEEARRSLRNALTALRKALGETALLTDRETVQFNPAYALHVDAIAFRTQAQHFLAAPAPTPAAVDLTLYRGDLLDGFYDDWILREREALRVLYLQVLLRLAQHWRTQGDYPQTIAVAQRILTLDPVEEAAHQHLLFCYTMTGDRQTAQRQYDACVHALREELDVEPAPETVALYRRSQQTRPRKPAATAAHTNLPLPVSSFIGRGLEIAKLKTLLLGEQARPQRPPARLVTITGPGGCGKTRLAIQVARALLDMYADGVWWVELAALSEESQVPQAVAKVLDVQQGVQPSLTDVLITNLRTKQTLLVLDNCEHLVAACAELAERLLSQCPDLQILTTSREALGIFGETSWLVPSLTLPSTQQNAPADYLQFEAIHLFVERAQAVQQHFTLTPANAAVILHICRQLDGIPLALELAAARVKAMTVAQLAERLDNVIGARFVLLDNGSRTVLPRQQTLRATVAWSYALLNEQEHCLLQRLAIFAGGWSLEAAEIVGAGVGQEPVASLLGRLVDKSLVLVEPQGEAVRYRALETILQYAYEQLEKSNTVAEVRNLHLSHFLPLAEQAASRLRSADQALWLGRLALEAANLRAALTWALSSQQADLGARLGIALWRFWYIRGYYAEGLEWLQKLLPMVDQPAQRANLLYGQGMLARRRGDTGAAVACFGASLALYRQLADQRGIASTLRGLGFMYYLRGAYATARPVLEEALALFRALDDQEGIAVTLDNLAYIADDLNQEQRLYQESLTLRRRSGNLHGITISLAGLAYHALNQGDYASVRVYLQEHLQINETLGNQDGIANSYLIQGQAAFAEGDYAAAQFCYEKSLAIYQAIGGRPDGLFACLGVIALKQGHYAEAHRLLGQALRLFYRTSALTEIARLFGYFATLALAEGQARRALILAGAALALYGSLSIYDLVHNQKDFECTLTAARQLLDEAAAMSAWATGQAMTLAQALAYALGEQGLEQLKT